MQQLCTNYCGLYSLVIIAISVRYTSGLQQIDVENTLRTVSLFQNRDKFSRKSVNVFEHGEGGFPCIRIPAITRCGSWGTLHAFAECRMRVLDGCLPVDKHSNTSQGKVFLFMAYQITFLLKKE